MMRRLGTFVLALFVGRPGLAYETDQLTHRSRPLKDALPEADARMDEIIELVVRRTNRQTGCRARPDRVRRILARKIHRQTAGTRLVWSRGPIRMMGFGKYEAWLESTPTIQRIDFLDRDDIYGELSLKESVILHLAGPASTIQVDGVRVGTDKFDHFFGEGYRYFQESHWGALPKMAIQWGTRTERTYFGLLTSRTFSFADLKANSDGFRFYADLLRQPSILQLDEQGCVEQVRPWDWSRWVDWRYDEVQNPSVYAPIVQWGIRRYLHQHRAAVCTDYARWRTPEYVQHLSQVLSTTPDYVYGPAPARADPYQLETLCQGRIPTPSVQLGPAGPIAGVHDPASPSDPAALSNDDTPASVEPDPVRPREETPGNEPAQSGASARH